MTDKRLKEECFELIEEHSPIDKQQIALETYDKNQVVCRECERMTDEYKQHESIVNEMLLQLLDENKIYQNAEWEYMVRTND